jgi:hypothetical protein
VEFGVHVLNEVLRTKVLFDNLLSEVFLFLLELI